MLKNLGGWSRYPEDGLRPETEVLEGRVAVFEARRCPPCTMREHGHCHGGDCECPSPRCDGKPWRPTS